MDLINKTNPILNFYPVNGVENLYDSWRKQLTKGTVRTKLLGDWVPQNDNQELVGSYPIDRVTLKTQDSIEEITLYNGGFHLPAAALPYGGRIESESFVTPAGATVAECVLRQPYARKEGAGRVALEIQVNDKVVGSIDPALNPQIGLLQIDNLVAGDRIKFILSCTVTREASSWRKASVSQFSELRFLAAEDGSQSPTKPFEVLSSKRNIQVNLSELKGTIR